MDRRTFLATAAGIGCGVSIAGCISGSADQSGNYDIGMSAKRFKPREITVEPETTVVWRNTNKQGHSVTAYEDDIPDDATYFASGDFGSQSEAEDAYRNSSAGVLTQGETYEHEFTVPGKYHYFCIPHEAAGMAGVVIVEEDA